jgi:hypothetical protein
MDVRCCPQCGCTGLGRSRAPYLFECVACDVIFICVPADGANCLGLTPRQLFAVDELRYALPMIGEHNSSDSEVSL